MPVLLTAVFLEVIRRQVEEILHRGTVDMLVHGWQCLVFHGKVSEGAQSDDQSKAKLRSSGPYVGSTVHFFKPGHELQRLQCTLVSSAAFV